MSKQDAVEMPCRVVGGTTFQRFFRVAVAGLAVALAGAWSPRDSHAQSVCDPNPCATGDVCTKGECHLGVDGETYCDPVCHASCNNNRVCDAWEDSSCGDCACVSQGCGSLCGPQIDNCNNPIDCGPCCVPNVPTFSYSPTNPVVGDLMTFRCRLLPHPSPSKPPMGHGQR